MLYVALALLAASLLDANNMNCTILTTSSCVNGGGSPLGPLRNASLSCLRRIADATSDFGTSDNERWAEYAPTCAVWDGVPFGVAEPLNAFSSLAYDEVVCVADLSFAHTALQIVKDRECPPLAVPVRSGSTPPQGAPDSRWPALRSQTTPSHFRTLASGAQAPLSHTCLRCSG